MPTAEVDIVQRLNTARQRVEEVSRENSRLTGELDSQRKRLNEEAAKCQKDFNCQKKELPSLITSLKETAEKQMATAEYVLGLREDAPVDDTPEPVQAPAKKSRIPARAPVTAGHDEDGL